VIKENLHYDTITDSLIIEREQDIEGILDTCKALANDAPTGWKGEVHHVASIPLIVYEKVLNETGIDLLKDKAAMKRFLNDPDNKFLRTKLGIV
jgi:hypothetical protein